MSETRFPERHPASSEMTPPHLPRTPQPPQLSRSSRTRHVGRYASLYTKANVRRIPVRRRHSKRPAIVLQKSSAPPALATISAVVRKLVSTPRLVNLAVGYVTHTAARGVMVPKLNTVPGMMRQWYRSLVMIGVPPWSLPKSSVCVRMITSIMYPRRAKTSLAKRMCRLSPTLHRLVRQTVVKLLLQIVKVAVQTQRLVTSPANDTKTPKMRHLLLILNHLAVSCKNLKMLKSGNSLYAVVLAKFLASRHRVTEALKKGTSSLCSLASSVAMSKAVQRLTSQALMGLAAQGMLRASTFTVWGAARLATPLLLSSKKLVKSTLAPRMSGVVRSSIGRLAVKLNMAGSLEVACVVLRNTSPILVSMATLTVSNVVTLIMKTLKSPTVHRMLSRAVHDVIVPGTINASRFTVQSLSRVIHRVLTSSAIRNVLSQATRKFIYIVIPLVMSSAVAVMMSPIARRRLSLMTQTFIVQPLQWMLPTDMMINTMHAAANRLVPHALPAVSSLALQSILFIRSQSQSVELLEIFKTAIPYLITFDNPRSVFRRVRHVMTSGPVQLFLYPALQSSAQISNQLHSLGYLTVSGITSSLQKLRSLQLWPQTAMLLEKRLLVLLAFQELLTSLQNMTYSEIVGFCSKTVQVLMSPEARSQMSSALRDFLSPAVRGLLASTVRGICPASTEADGNFAPPSVQEMVYGLMRMLTSPALQKLIYPVLRSLLTPAVQAASLPWLQDILHPARHYFTFWADKIPHGNLLRLLSITQ